MRDHSCDGVCDGGVCKARGMMRLKTVDFLDGWGLLGKNEGGKTLPGGGTSGESKGRHVKDRCLSHRFPELCGSSASSLVEGVSGVVRGVVSNLSLLCIIPGPEALSKVGGRSGAGAGSVRVYSAAGMKGTPPGGLACGGVPTALFSSALGGLFTCPFSSLVG